MCPKVPPLATMHNGKRSSQSCSRRPGCWQERTAAQARAASALSVTRPRTATISRLTTFQAGRVQQVQAAWTMTRPVPAEWCKVCILVVRAWRSQWPVRKEELFLRSCHHGLQSVNEPKHASDKEEKHQHKRARLGGKECYLFCWQKTNGTLFVLKKNSQHCGVNSVSVCRTYSVSV